MSIANWGELYPYTATFTYHGPTLSTSPATLAADISTTPDLTSTVIDDVLAATGEFYFISNTWGMGVGVDSYTGDSRSLTVTLTLPDMMGVTQTITDGDHIHLQLSNNNNPGGNAITVYQRVFGTNCTAAELSKIRVNGTAQLAGVNYNLVTRGDGKADIVFTSGHGPANGAAITADVTIGGDNAWAADSGIEASISQLKTATENLRTTASGIYTNNSVLTTRLDFITDMTDVLKTGADNLTLADMNEEGANMLMLQTRQSLGITALSLSAQAAQAILYLF